MAKEIGNDGRGVYVVGVVEDSGAEKAGIQARDVILEIDGDRIVGPGHLGELLVFYSPGDEIKVKVWRDGRTQTLAANLGERKVVTASSKIAILKGEPRAWLGVTVQNLAGQLGTYFGSDKGVLVSSVVDGSPAEKAGIRAGDVITMVGEDEIEEPVDLPNLISERDPGAEVTVTLVRRGKRLGKNVVLGETPEEQRKKAQVFLWDSEDGDKCVRIEGDLHGLQELRGLELLGLPGLADVPVPPGTDREVHEEMEQLKKERETLRTEMEALAKEMEILQRELEELRKPGVKSE